MFSSFLPFSSNHEPLLSSHTHELGIERKEELRVRRGLFCMKIGIAVDHVLSYKTIPCSIPNCKLEECECYFYHDEKHRLPLSDSSKCKKIRRKCESFRSVEEMWEAFQIVFGEKWVIQRIGCSDLVASVAPSEEEFG
jgi:hypothetical protein